MTALTATPVQAAANRRTPRIVRMHSFRTDQDLSDEGIRTLIPLDPRGRRSEGRPMTPHFDRFGERRPAALSDRLRRREHRGYA